MDAMFLFNEIGDELKTTQDAVGAKMFGMPSLKIAGKAFAGLHEDHMVFKLRGEALVSALALEGSKHFDPMGGRPMKEWIKVPHAHADRWRELAETALTLQREANS